MEIVKKRKDVRFVKFIGMAILVIFAVVMLTGAAYADIAQDVRGLFELHARILPGMTIEALSAVLGPPIESHAVPGSTPVMRYVWLQGVKGVVAYEVNGAAHRISVTLPVGDNQNQNRALDSLTRQGQARYGSLPRSDSSRGEHYWIRDGIRFAFSRHNQNAVRSTATRAQ